MKIKRLICAPARTGFYFDDQAAVVAGAKHDGLSYAGDPVTPGFVAIRQAGEAISVMLELDNGQIAHGDCAAVQYSGAGGRDPLFLADEFIEIINEYVAPVLIGEETDNFHRLARLVEGIERDGRKLHTAIRYGVTQALLDAVALSKRKLMCEVVADEYHTEISQEPIPIFTQSGDDRYDNADKMIIKHVPVLPHALINNVVEKLGKSGSILLDYVKWLVDRILEIRNDDDYKPIIHLDVYGTIGRLFGNSNYELMADYMAALEEAAKPFQIRIEGPMDSGSKEKQIEDLANLRALLDKRNIKVELVADEWCNTLEDIKEFVDRKAGHMVQVKTPDLGGLHNSIEAVLYCRDKDVKAYQGGTCNETDRSAEVCVHLAMATKPAQILAKPGMGVDEAFMIAYNEMQRIIALRKNR